MTVKYDRATKAWFSSHIGQQTTVCHCDKCGLFFKPSLGHKCKRRVIDMTIDEAILLERETVRRNKMMLELNKLMQESHAVCFDKIKRETSIRIHEQLAEWLEELKSLKENSISKEAFEKMKSRAYKKGHRQGYNKALDDFVNFANTMPTVEEEDGTIRPMWLEEMIERLKAGGENEI